MLNVDAAMDYLAFVSKRHAAWEARQRGDAGPWTDDPILNSRKFTNTFRVLDPGTQFVFELAPPELSARETLMRCFLYRHTGSIPAWRYAQEKLGRFPLVADLPELFEVWTEYRGAGVLKLKAPRRPDQVGRGNGKQSMNYIRPVFTGAYIVNDLAAAYRRPERQQAVVGPNEIPGEPSDKARRVLDMTYRLFREGDPEDIVPEFLAAGSQSERFELLRRAPSVGEFMAMQVLTDWGYTTQCGVDREAEFVYAGPGAVRGAKFLDPRAPAGETIRWAQSAIEATAGVPRLQSRPLSLMDVQNTLCEFSKYARFQDREPATKLYRPAHPGRQQAPVLPEHWKAT